MKNRRKKGTFGYRDQNKIMEWQKAAGMLAIPILIFLVGWLINKSRLNVLTVVAIVGCLPGCNQVVRAIMASRYHSIDRSLYEQTEQVRGDRMALYENVFTSYEQNYYIDALVISGRDVVGFSSEEKIDAGKAAEHIRTMLKNSSYKQNVKIFTSRKDFIARVETLSSREPESVPFREDERFPGMDRDEIIRAILLNITL
jgi:hypothetical protein